jgi:hypothetical protein
MFAIDDAIAVGRDRGFSRVCRTVVDDDDLEIAPGLPERRFDGFGNERRDVARGHDHADCRYAQHNGDDEWKTPTEIFDNAGRKP